MSPTTETSAPSAPAAEQDEWSGILPEGIVPYDVFEQQSESYDQALLVSGLQNSRAVVRWFCLNKLAENPDGLGSAEVSGIKRMAEEDPDDEVRQAAKFVMEIVGKTYRGEAFAHPADGKRAAYRLFQEARFNDGRVWLATDGKSRLIFESGASVTQLLFSPDGKKLAVGYGGRIWNAIAVLDATGSGSAAPELPDLIGMVLGNPENGYNGIKIEDIPRFDPYVTIKSWSPDSRKFLFAYQFGDKDFNTQYGFGVYDVCDKKVTKVYKMETDGRDTAPEGFHW
ncbi:hypothetical protein [Cohnella caldifontis]|uniref:hypothetical protein n=1 Tax=Cohnella caldifontis TaxID=3027471 RepID=UPI0023EB0EDA|nr:hypothetical protein [Cohnella sp. YIM B05605]